MLSLYGVRKSPRIQEKCLDLMGRGAIFLVHAMGSFSNTEAPDTRTRWMDQFQTHTSHCTIWHRIMHPFGQHHNLGMLCLLGVVWSLLIVRRTCEALVEALKCSKVTHLSFAGTDFGHDSSEDLKAPRQSFTISSCEHNPVTVVAFAVLRPCFGVNVPASTS